MTFFSYTLRSAVLPAILWSDNSLLLFVFHSVSQSAHDIRKVLLRRRFKVSISFQRPCNVCSGFFCVYLKFLFSLFVAKKSQKRNQKRTAKTKGVLKSNSDFVNGGGSSEARALEIYTMKLMKEGKEHGRSLRENKFKCLSLDGLEKNSCGRG